jgi:hypothetical protein
LGRQDDNDEDLDLPPELSFNYMEIPAREAVSAGVIKTTMVRRSKTETR